jgi:hypothetical protein
MVPRSSLPECLASGFQGVSSPIPQGSVLEGLMGRHSFRPGQVLSIDPRKEVLLKKKVSILLRLQNSAAVSSRNSKSGGDLQLANFVLRRQESESKTAA